MLEDKENLEKNGDGNRTESPSAGPLRQFLPDELRQFAEDGGFPSSETQKQDAEAGRDKLLDNIESQLEDPELIDTEGKIIVEASGRIAIKMKVVRVKPVFKPIMQPKEEEVPSEVESEYIDMACVYSDDENDPNHSWSKFTPSGNLSFHVTNPDIFGLLVEGEERVLLFSPPIQQRGRLHRV